MYIMNEGFQRASNHRRIKEAEKTTFKSALARIDSAVRQFTAYGGSKLCGVCASYATDKLYNAERGGSAKYVPMIDSIVGEVVFGRRKIAFDIDDIGINFDGNRVLSRAGICVIETQCTTTGTGQGNESHLHIRFVIGIDDTQGGTLPAVLEIVINDVR